MRKLLGFYVLFGLVENLFAAEPLPSPLFLKPPPAGNLNRIDAQQQRQNEQIVNQAEKLRSQADVRISTDQKNPTIFPVHESFCYVIQQTVLADYSDKTEATESHFKWVLNKAVKELNVTLPHCFGSEGLAVLLRQVQNNIIQKGYVTTRVVVPEQDLTDSIFHVTVIPGKIRSTIVADANEKTWVSWLTAATAMTFEWGDV